MKRLLCAFLFATAWAPIVCAQENGQIININQNNQVAFTDLDNRLLKRGDLVKIFVNDDEFVYMQVVESSNMLSKLGVSQNEDFKTNLSDLPHIVVGNKVVPVSAAASTDVKNTKVENVAEISHTDTSSNSLQIQTLSLQLKQDQEEIDHLRKLNKLLESQLSEALARADERK
ncbi:MAG: hypothetical protein HQL13_03570, partial [Candidatus Omnitrophica bacterium]|nr:hypothetical protein [Candidatus Omnitrophota bacterium]